MTKINTQSAKAKTILIPIIKHIRKGKSKEFLVDFVVNNYNLSEITANNYIRAAYKMVNDWTTEKLNELKSIQQERIEALFNEAVESNDRTNALKALDLINKMNGYYTEKIEADVTVTDYTFKFGGEDE